jgi:acyl carrier protein
VKGEQPQALQLELRSQLAESSPNERHSLLMNFIQVEVGKIMGFEASQLPDPQRGLFDMGMDSLMAVELRNLLQTSCGFSLPSTLVFKYPTIQDLVEYLAKELSKGETVDMDHNKGEDKQALILSEIEHLSEDAIEASIAEELKKILPLLQGEK